MIAGALAHVAAGCAESIALKPVRVSSSSLPLFSPSFHGAERLLLWVRAPPGCFVRTLAGAATL